MFKHAHRGDPVKVLLPLWIELAVIDQLVPDRQMPIQQRSGSGLFS